jgi:surfactin synthase thioesterase subunit
MLGYVEYDNDDAQSTNSSMSSASLIPFDNTLSALEYRDRNIRSKPLFVLGQSFGGFVCLELARYLRETCFYDVSGIFAITIDPPNKRKRYNSTVRYIFRNIVERPDGKRIGLNYRTVWSSQAARDMFWSSIAMMDKYPCPTEKKTIGAEKVLGKIPMSVIQAEHDVISDNRKSSGWIDYTSAEVDLHLIRNASHLLLLDSNHSKSVAKIVYSRMISWKNELRERLEQQYIRTESSSN